MLVQIKVIIYADDKLIRKHLLKNNFTCCHGNGCINKNKIYHVHDRDAIKSQKATTFIQHIETNDPFIYGAQFKSALHRKFNATRAEVICSPIYSSSK